MHNLPDTTTWIILMDNIDTYCEVYDFNSIRSFILEEKGEWTMEDQVRIEMLEEGLNPTSVSDINKFWYNIVNNSGV